jgi:arsenate reductase
MAETKKIHVLFVCSANASRSQMAEAFCEKMKGDCIEAFSAGANPAPRLSRNAVKVMAEIGIDISDNTPKPISDLTGLKFDYVITLCDSIRHLTGIFPKGAKHIHHGVEDPSSFIGTIEETMNKFRQSRDQIKEYIETLPESLTKETNG